MHNTTPMVVDCGTCPVRESRCDDCIVTVLGALPLVSLDGTRLPLDAGERRAVEVFVRAGMVTSAEAGAVSARREPWGGVRAVG